MSVYSAPDYSLTEDGSRAFWLTSVDQREEEEDEADEGIGEEVKGGDEVGQVIALCRHHLAMEHYRNVVRALALAAVSSELNQFMSRFEDLTC